MEQGDKHFLGCSQDVFSPHGQDDFCTRDNWQTAVLYLAQEMEGFGLASPCTKTEGGDSQASLDVITLVNSSWKLTQMFRSCQRRFEDMETATRRAASDRERLMNSAAKQREEIEQRERMIAETKEQERQASELVEATNNKLKAAKEEVRKLMSVLMQRETKYSHEIRRAEQESVKLKERLSKVLMERGEGRGVNIISMTGPVPGSRGSRAQWNTEQSANKREEELVKRVLEEMSKRETAAADINTNTQSALSTLASAVRESLIELEVDPGDVAESGSELNCGSEMLLQQTRDLALLLRQSVKKLKKPSDVILVQEKMTLYEEKLALYEQILVNFESSKEKQDWILQELKNLQKVSKESLLAEKCQMYESQEQIERMKLELSEEYSKLENLKNQFIRESTGLSAEDKEPSSIILKPGNVVVTGGGGGGSVLPSWARGPVQVTPSSRQHCPGSGVVLGHSSVSSVSRPVSRPGSRPGSQPGSRAPSVHRDRPDKSRGKSPAANLITRRQGGGGGGGSRMIDTYTASLGRTRQRPKSATISPSRTPASSVNRRSQAFSRSPSRGKEVTRDSRVSSSMSLPRHSNQLCLKTSDKMKRNSGAWSKPPTPGPLSPATSDSETGQSNYSSYRSGLPRSSMI